MMVLHGYERPGHGYVNGKCWGVGWQPWETSPDGTIAYVERMLQPLLDTTRERLARLEAGVSEIAVEEYDYVKRQPTFKTLTPADGYEFKSAVRSKSKRLGVVIAQVTRDIEDRTERVRNWQRGQVQTEEEVVRKREKVTDQRRALLDQARQAKLEKRAALDAKQRAREQEREDLIREYRQIFEELAQDRSEQSKRLAREHWVKMNKRKSKKGYLHFYPSVLESDEALFVLGLARPSGRGSYIDYAYDSGIL